MKQDGMMIDAKIRASVEAPLIEVYFIQIKLALVT